MASAMLHMSMLPAIKCSSCGSEVELSMMGDHVCGPTTVTMLETLTEQSPPPTPDPQPKEVEHALETAEPHEASSPSPTSQPLIEEPEDQTLKPAKSPPPRIDLQAANGYNEGAGSLLSPSSIASGTLSHSTAPLSPSVATPHSDTTVSTFPQSPTPEILATNDGESWPRFPIDEPPPAPAQMAAPSRALSRGKSLRKKVSNLTVRPDAGATSEASLAPLSPSLNGSANILKRMNTISPGPFEAKHKRSDSKDRAAEKGGFSNLFRRKSTKKKSLDKISGPVPMETPAPPLPIANMFAEPQRQMTPPETVTPPLKMDNFGQPLPEGPAPPRPARPANVEGVIEQMRRSTLSMDGNLQGIAAKQAGAPDVMPEAGTTSQDEQTAPPVSRPRVASDASVYTTVSAGDRSTTFSKGLPQITEDEDAAAGSDTTGSVPPPAWPAGRLRSLSRSSDKSLKPDAAPPVPNLTTSTEQLQQHTPSGSMSSSDARSVFDDRRESSRSSPPTSTTSSFSPRKESLDEQQAETSSPTLELLPSMAYVRPVASFSRPRAPTETEGQPPTPKLDLAPPTPPKESSPKRSLSPSAREVSRLRTEHSPSASQSSARSGSKRYVGPGKFAMAPASPMFPPPPPIPQDLQSLPGRPSSRSSSRARRRSDSIKTHECRGCGLTIEGKSIKAADGRLTGRWHRECFVCKTCKERFESADFYIINNDPYCAEHYHVLNGSLCAKCHKGVEGRFLETSQKRQKYHVHCFTCSECLKPLSKDYFEMDDQVHCETCASKQHNKSTLLTPGRKFPERRTTKLMMM